jgi:hypothetical protein
MAVDEKLRRPQSGLERLKALAAARQSSCGAFEQQRAVDRLNRTRGTEPSTAATDTRNESLSHANLHLADAFASSDKDQVVQQVCFVCELLSFNDCACLIRGAQIVILQLLGLSEDR